MFLPYGKQTISDDDIAAVVAALKSDYLTTGPEVEAFEREFAEMLGAKHAVAVNNATAALHLAMLVAEIGEGDRVVTSPNTFLSSANCAAFVGATPDFADIDPATYNLCPKALEAGWRDDTKAVIAVAYAGLPCDMPAIAEVAHQRGAIVIEDGCHGPGGGFIHEGKFYKIGAHPWADITTFSFHPVKTMTTGEGGMLVTDNDEYAAKARLLRAHGITRDAAAFTNFVADEAADMGYGISDMGKKNAPISSEQSELISHIQRSEYPSGSAAESPISHIRALRAPGPWTYEMQALGYNYRITDIQCALGRSQLKRLPDFIHRRQEIVDQYNSAFADIAWLRTPCRGYAATQLPGDAPRSGAKDTSAPPTEDGRKEDTPISSEAHIPYPAKRISHNIQRSEYPAPRSESASPSGSAAASSETPCVSWHLYTVQIDFPALGKSRNEVMDELRGQGVGTQVLYIPVYLQPWYQETYGYAAGKCPNAEAYYLKSLSLPLYPAMTDDDVEHVIKAVSALMTNGE